MTIALVVITDGRQDCLFRTMQAFQAHLDGDVNYSLLIDDSGDTTYAGWLDSTFPSFQVVHHTLRRGFAGAVISAWENVPECDYIVTFEDDMVLTQDVRVNDLITILDVNPQLAQVVLKRQAWNSDEESAGGIIELHPDDYTERETNGIVWTEHHRHYSTNVNLMPYRITRLGWPNVEHSEGMFGGKLKEMGYSFAYYGHKFDAPRVKHIGLQRVGTYY